MEVCTNSNIVAYAETISGYTIDQKNMNLSEAKFKEIVDTIFNNISDFSKWSRGKLTF